MTTAQSDRDESVDWTSHPLALAERRPEPGAQLPAAVGRTEDAFWGSRVLLSTVHAAARAQQVSPWAALAATLVRLSLAVPPSVVLPPLGRATTGHASLALFVGLAARSGGGKGLADAAARGTLTMPLDGRPVRTIGSGSAEGVADAFTEWIDDPDDIDAGKKAPRKVPQPFPGSVHISDSEIDKLAGLLKRDGSTLGGTLRGLWGGEAVSFPYRGKAVDITVHSYRVGLTLGVQLTQAGPLFEQAGGGTLQRFLWAPASNPFRDYDPPQAPAPLVWHEPRWPEFTDGLRVLDVVAPVRRELWVAHVDRDQLDPEETRSNEIRLRVAALLAIADRRTDVTEADWTDAGAVVAISRQTRIAAREALAAEARRQVRSRAEARGEAEVIVDERVRNAAHQRIANRVLRYLGKEPLTSPQLRRKFDGTERGTLDAVLADLVDEGQVTATEIPGQGQRGIRYALPEGA